MIFQTLPPHTKDYESFDIDEKITRKVVFTAEQLAKHPSIRNITLTYYECHPIYNIHSFNDVEMGMQSIVHFSKQGQYWYWQSFGFGTPIHNGVDTLLKPAFQGFLVESQITEQEFRNFILDFQELNDKFIKELSVTA